MGIVVDWHGCDRVIVVCMDGAAMSVINQVLNQLEQRGAHTAAEQTMVRAVPAARRNFTMPLLVFGLVLVAGIAIWQAVQSRKPDAAIASNVPKAGNAPDSHELKELQHRPVEMVAPVSGGSVANMPASRLSFELSSVPLPSTIRHDSEQALKDEKDISTNPDAAVKPVKKSSKKTSGKPAKTQPTKTSTSNAEVAVQKPDGAVPMKQISPEQQADAEFRKASALMRQGRIADAMSGYTEALRLDPGNDAARQALVALLLESKKGTDAERVLQERLKSKPDLSGFTMMLARLQVERGAVAEATATLEKALPYASSQADYQAFLAALLQRQNRNDEAIAHYRIALQIAPNNGIWLMGYGISLQALQRNADAKVAFQHALDTQTLSPDLQAFVRQKLKGL
jgi:MSHA biogenesis protein MshN